MCYVLIKHGGHMLKDISHNSALHLVSESAYQMKNSNSGDKYHEIGNFHKHLTFKNHSGILFELSFLKIPIR